MQLEHSFTVPVPVADAWKVLLDIEQIAPCMPGAVLDSIDGDAFTGRVKVKLGPISLTYKGKASFVKKDEAAHIAVIDAAGKDQRGNGTAAATVTATLTDDGGSSTRVDVLTDLNITGKPAQFGRGVMVDVGNKLIGQFATCVEGKLSGSRNSEGRAESTVPAAADATDTAAGGAAPGMTAATASPTGGATGSPAGTETGTSGSPAGARTGTSGGGGGAETDTTGAKQAKSSTSATGAGPGPGPGAGGSRLRAVPSREPEPIDLLDVAGGSVLTRIGIPAAGLTVAVAILYSIIRRIRN